MEKALTNTQLFSKYAVRTDYNTVNSGIVYPMDMGTKFKFHGYINEEDVKDFLHIFFGKAKRIANKCAIPFMQVAEIHTVQTFFYYQHDNKTCLISLTEEHAEYFG